MSNVAEIEKAVAALAPNEFARFRVWFDDLLAERFDQAIADDIARARLDDRAEQALSNVRKCHD